MATDKNIQISIPIEITNNKQKENIVENIIKMLIERGIVKPKNYNEYVRDVIASIKDDDTFEIKVSHYEDSDDSDIYKIILLLDQKISTITKASVIGEYIYKNTKIHKIVIVQDITQRAHQSIQTNFPLVEIFLKRDMMFNLIDSIYVPKHILLTREESSQFIKEYGVQKKELPRIFVSDPVARYYNAKIGQIFKIIRPSETSGYSNYYRIVVTDTIQRSKK